MVGTDEVDDVDIGAYVRGAKLGDVRNGNDGTRIGERIAASVDGAACAVDVCCAPGCPACAAYAAAKPSIVGMRWPDGRSLTGCARSIADTRPPSPTGIVSRGPRVTSNVAPCAAPRAISSTARNASLSSSMRCIARSGRPPMKLARPGGNAASAAVTSAGARRSATGATAGCADSIGVRTCAAASERA